MALILAGEIHYPRSIGPIAKSLIRDLLDPEVRSRLGCRPASLSPALTSSSSSSSLSVSSPVAALAGTKKAAVVGGGGGGGLSRALSVGRGTSLAPRPPAEPAGGWQSVKQHGFFKDMDWGALLRGEIAAPIKPAAVGRGMVGNFAREYTRQRAGWGGDQQELRDVADKEGLFKRELMGFDFVRD